MFIKEEVEEEVGVRSLQGLVNGSGSLSRDASEFIPSLGLKDGGAEGGMRCRRIVKELVRIGG